jgi:hypothetical protein
MAKAGAHGETSGERRLDFASGRDQRGGAAIYVGGAEAIASDDGRTANEVRRHRNRARLWKPRPR